MIFVKIQHGLWYFAANLFAINPAILGSILPGSRVNNNIL